MINVTVLRELMAELAKTYTRKWDVKNATEVDKMLQGLPVHSEIFGMAFVKHSDLHDAIVFGNLNFNNQAFRDLANLLHDRRCSCAEA